MAFARAATGRFTHRPWTPADDAAGRWFVISVDIQVLLGLLLYFFFSSFTMAAWRDMAGAMADEVIRFWAVEHVIGMLAATAFVHVGRVRIRKTSDSPAQALPRRDLLRPGAGADAGLDPVAVWKCRPAVDSGDLRETGDPGSGIRDPGSDD